MGLFYIVVDQNTNQIVCEGNKPTVYDYIDKNKTEDTMLKVFVEV